MDHKFNFFCNKTIKVLKENWEEFFFLPLSGRMIQIPEFIKENIDTLDNIKIKI